MDIKDLNKSQLILLAVLLSFVTSIATGITTVTLMQQAPASFTVPVNRVVKQTIENIQQVKGDTTVQTVIIKEEDLVVDAIAKNQSTLFSVTKEILDEEGKTVEASLGKGFAISTDGIVVVDGSSVSGKGIYYLKNDSGKFKAEFVLADKAGFSFLKIGDAVDGKSLPAQAGKAVFTVPAFGDLSKMKIGQKILVLGNTISFYIFEVSNKDVKEMNDIKINVTRSNAGGLVLNLDGEVLGIALYDDNRDFAPIDTINSALKLFLNPATTTPAAPVLAPQ